MRSRVKLTPAVGFKAALAGKLPGAALNVNQSNRQPAKLAKERLSLLYGNISTIRLHQLMQTRAFHIIAGQRYKIKSSCRIDRY